MRTLQGLALSASWHRCLQRVSHNATGGRVQMRIVLTTFLLSVLLTGCRTGAGGTSSVAPLPGRSPAPPAVLRLADACVDSLAGQKPPDGDHIREDFIRHFFRGFTMPGATMRGGTEAGRRGFLAGQEFRRANPTRVRETMEGYGYTATEAEGTWTVFFEHSGFRPDSQPRQTWWLSYLGDTRSNIPKGMEIPEGGVHIRAAGFLSPSGHYGHLGGYDHEFFATTIFFQK